MTNKGEISMSEEQEVPNSEEIAVPEPTPAAQKAHVIRVGHTASGFVGPFASRQEAETYLEAKRGQTEDDRWDASRVEIVTAEQASREREEARARELMGR